MGSALKFKNTNVPRQPGELARLKVVQGPDRGSIYVLTGARAAIGRGEDADVVVMDLKASRKHAEIFSDQSGWGVRDLGSANGISFNGAATKLARIKTGDTIRLGETTLEFMGGESGTMMLVAPAKDVSRIEKESAEFQARRDRVRNLGVFGAFDPKSRVGTVGGNAGAAAKDKRPLLYGGALLVLASILFTDEIKGILGLAEPPKKIKKAEKKKDDSGRDLAGLLPGSGDPSETMVRTFFASGFREFRAQNYLRAKAHFETVLQMAPGDEMADRYLKRCDSEIKSAIDGNMEQGRKNLEAGKLKSAKANFEAVLRFLSRNQSDPAYMEAKDQLSKAEKLIKGGPG